MPFPRALAQIEMQAASSRIWIWVVDSISYNNNHWTKHASKCNNFKNFVKEKLDIILGLSLIYFPPKYIIRWL